MKKVILVKTDDPDKTNISLVVTGPVEKIVDIQPESVYLNGNPGDTLEAVVTITPSEKYPFKILGMEQKGNARTQSMLMESKDDKKSWRVSVKATSDKVQTLYDVLTLKTDSQYKKILTIRVYAVFVEKPVPKS